MITEVKLSESDKRKVVEDPSSRGHSFIQQLVCGAKL
jgi:hypothetical protein